MATVEAPVPVVLWEDNDEVPEFVAHLYSTLTPEKTYCGIPASSDPHAKMHSPVFWEGPGTVCPTCEAPICPACEGIAR